jgi:uncharacterized membrane protein YeiB
VLGMIGVHLAGTEGGGNLLERSLTGFLALVEPVVGALFCVLVGVSWAIQSERSGTSPHFRPYVVRRALVLGSFGILLHVLLWPTEILLPIALMMAGLLVMQRAGPRTTAGVALLFIAAAPVVTFLFRDHAVTDWAGDGLHLADSEIGWATVRYLLFTGNYPLVSWMAFPLMGSALWRATDGEPSAIRRWGWLALAAVLLSHTAAALAGLRVPALGADLSSGWTPTSARFLITAGGWAIAVIAGLVLWRGKRPMPRGLLPVVLVGRASLSHYVLHIAIAYGALRVWYPAEDWSVAAGALAMVAYLLVTLPLTMIWFRDHRQGPLETLWGRASSRTNPAPARTPG